MLQKLRIINFRSIETMDLYFEKINNIIWNNGAWKTNILQAILCLFQSNHSLGSQEILKNGTNHIFIEWVFTQNDGLENKLTFSYDAQNDKKLVLLNGKKVTKKVLHENILHISYFSPISMNLFYLGPKYRRDFLDDILKSTFWEYDTLLKNYEKILKHRNKILKNIAEEKSKIDEIYFWNNEFIKSAVTIYEYRKQINQFLKENIKSNSDVFQHNFANIEYIYTSKVDMNRIGESIKEYLEKNLQRDIILGKTHIWPHIDDFDIRINEKSLVDFASRWEIKSIIINLKLQEINFIHSITKKLPIVLIDDLSSELDSEHSKLVLEKLWHLQIIFTSILALNSEEISTIQI